MHLKTLTTGKKHVGIDAKECGSLVRFMNHSCDPSARFHEVQCGSQLTVVAVTVKEVGVGEPITVSYGNDLWFVCRCNFAGC
ncbi:hypothetical protein PR001_g6262 [Phytophthora rubi]|nr:hypothetical protein PR001_g6262 [Phytophthora rubi]